MSLLNATFTWIKDNLKEEIDFVVWTGDSARHDNDERIPRSEQQIVSQNELVVQSFLDVFGKPENFDDDDPTNDFLVPIIPTLGNNDVLPHNIFTDGPNRWTQNYLKIWRQFIPEAQRHQFQRGGWFFVEVIPNKLAVFSMNTLYFFTSNSAVDGCARKNQPGYEQLEWLRIQLDILRQRGMKAILTGHVPPARVERKTSWDETCWQKYTLWQQQYRDIIVASLFGHMNIDHFMLQDFKDIKKKVKQGHFLSSSRANESHADFTVQGMSDYLNDLRSSFAQVPRISHSITGEQGQSQNFIQKLLSMVKGGKRTSPISEIGGIYGERYSLSLVHTSIVPNYLPSFRVYKYNTTGLDTVAMGSDGLPHDNLDISLSSRAKKKHKSKPESNSRSRKKTKFTVPEPPSKSSPPGPAYSPQSLTLLGYTQYYANLTYINHDFRDKAENDAADLSWKEGKHRGKKPPSQGPQPNPFAFEVEYSTFNDKIYKLQDLTLRSYLKLAQRITEPPPKTIATGVEVVGTERSRHKGKGSKKVNEVWYTFVQRAFVGTKDDEYIRERFGGEAVQAKDAADAADASLEL